MKLRPKSFQDVIHLPRDPKVETHHFQLSLPIAGMVLQTKRFPASRLANITAADLGLGGVSAGVSAFLPPHVSTLRDLKFGLLINSPIPTHLPSWSFVTLYSI